MMDFLGNWWQFDRNNLESYVTKALCIAYGAKCKSQQLCLLNAFHTKSSNSYLEGKKWDRGEKNASIEEMPLKYLCKEHALKSDRTSYITER